MLACTVKYSGTYALSLLRYWLKDLIEQCEKRNGLLKMESVSVLGALAMTNWLSLEHSLSVPSCCAPTLYTINR